MEKLLRPWPAGHALNLIDTFIMLKAKQNKLSSCHKSILGMGNLYRCYNVSCGFKVTQNTEVARR